MTTTLAQRTQQRKRAAEAAAQEPSLTMEGASIYEMHMAQLQQDRLRLSNIQSMQEKALLKQQLITTYLPYIQGVLEAGRGLQDEVITTLMIWCVDAEQYGLAIELATYVLTHNIAMPDRFNRDPATLIAEEVAEAALKALKIGTAFDLQYLQNVSVLTGNRDMPDEVRAKVHLALGRHLTKAAHTQLQTMEENQDPALNDAHRFNLVGLLTDAKEQLTQAISRHGACGGKKDLEGVERLLKKHAAPQAS